MMKGRAELLVVVLLFSGALALGQDGNDPARLPGGRLSTFAEETDQLPLQADELFTQARNLEMQGRLDEAYTLYRHTWLKDPGHYRSLYHAGRLLEQIGRPLDAELAYREACRIAPDFYASHNALGLLLRQQARYTDAEKAFTGAAEAAPDYAPAWRNLGRARIDNGDLYGAVDPWIEAVRLEPKDIESRVTLGLLLARVNEYPGAEEHLSQALALAPENKRARQGLEQVLARPGSGGDVPTYQLALPKSVPERGLRTSEDPVWVFRAPKIPLEDPDGLKRVGLEQVRREEFEAAAVALEKAAAHGGPDATVLSALGYARYRLGQPIAAADAYGEAARAMEQPEAWLYVNRGIAFLEAGLLADATRSFGYAVKVDERFERGWYALGLGRLERGQNRRALRALKQAASLAPDNPDIQTALATAHTRLGHKSAAVTAYRRALHHRPDDPDLLMSLARLLEVQGRTAEAGEIYAEFVRSSRNDPGYESWREMALRKATLFQPELTILEPERPEERVVQPVDVYGHGRGSNR